MTPRLWIEDNDDGNMYRESARPECGECENIPSIKSHNSYVLEHGISVI